MKILHVGKYYPPTRGGMETVLENLTEGCLARGHDVSVLVSSEGPERASTTLGGTGRLIRLPRAGLLNSQPLTLSLVSELRREITRFDPDVVHLHFPNPLGAAAWRLLGLTGFRLPPLFVWHHADITRQKVGRLLAAPLQGSCLSRAAGVCVSSADLRDHARELVNFRDRTTVIPFGIAPEPWVSVRARGGGPFLFVGRLVPYKGLDILFRALGQVPAARLTVVGSGPQAGSLNDTVTALGLTDRVHFTGEISSEDLLAVMESATAMVLPSVDPSETFGLVQLEAMAAGLPVIATDLPTGVAGVGAGAETGRLVPPGDVAALAGALSDLGENPYAARDMGAAARARFLDRFTRDHMIDRLLDFYRAGLARR